jgi:hypothetical protein
VSVTRADRAGTMRLRSRSPPRTTKETRTMLKGGLLWLIGIPIPVIIVLWLLGYL